MKVHKMEIDEGRKLLLKFKDESIMELKNRKKNGALREECSVVIIVVSTNSRALASC